MRRQIESTQRQMRTLEFLVDGTGTAALSGPASKQATLTDNGTGDYTITFSEPFGNTPVVIVTPETSAIIARVKAKSNTAITIETLGAAVTSGTASVPTSVNTPTVSEQTASLDTALGFKLFSKLPGALGNSISYEQTTGATAGSEAVSLTNTAGAYKVAVQIEDGVSTSLQVFTAIMAAPGVMNVVSLQVTDETVAQAALVEANLAGGVDAVAGAASVLGSANTLQTFAYAATDADFHVLVMGSEVADSY